MTSEHIGENNFSRLTELSYKIVDDDRTYTLRISLERSLLTLSGLDTREQVTTYSDRIYKLNQKFHDYRNSKQNGKSVAQDLHEFLWDGYTDIEGRYKKDQLLITEVIDSQLADEPKPVGNCLGLAALYAILAVSNGIDVSLRYPKSETHLFV